MRTKTVLQIALIIFVTSGICSCTKKIYVPVESVRTEYIDRMQRDSIYVLDSVRIVERNDTIFNTKYKTTFRYRNVRDSIYIKDTIRVPFEVEKIVNVEKALSFYQSICVKGFSFLVAALLGIVAYLLRKKLFAVGRWIISKVM